MYSSGHVDWLAVTYPAGTLPNATLPSAARQDKWRDNGRGRYGYRKALKSEFGALIMNDGDERQGVHLVLAGDALADMRSAYGVTDKALCQHVRELGGKVARIDLAIDLFDAETTPADLATAYNEQRLKTSARGATQVQQLLMPNATFYLGSRSSDRFFRAYNKGAQIGVPDMNWLRLELELKKLRARGAAAAIADASITRRVINRAIGDFMSVPDNDELTDAMKDDAAYIPPVQRKLPNTYVWLIEQVAPAIARYQVEHPDEDIMSALDTAVQAILGKLEPPTE